MEKKSGCPLVWELYNNRFSSSWPLFRPASYLASREGNSPECVHHTGMKEVKMVLVAEIETE